MSYLSRRTFLLASSFGIASILGLSACSTNSASWYQIENLLARKPSEIVTELEDNQGLEYKADSASAIRRWDGSPKDSPIESGTDISIMFKNDSGILSREDMESDDSTITGLTLFFSSNAMADGDAITAADELAEKCGLTESVGEGNLYDTKDFWRKVGTLNDGEGIWYITVSDTTVMLDVDLTQDEDDAKDMAATLQ